MLGVMSAVAEQMMLREITRRLAQDFPASSPTDVDAAVQQAYARFESSRIRDFIPLFVEKHARHDLGQRSSAVPV